MSHEEHETFVYYPAKISGDVISIYIDPDLEPSSQNLTFEYAASMVVEAAESMGTQISDIIIIKMCEKCKKVIQVFEQSSSNSKIVLH